MVSAAQGPGAPHGQVFGVLPQIAPAVHLFKLRVNGVAVGVNGPPARYSFSDCGIQLLKSFLKGNVSAGQHDATGDVHTHQVGAHSVMDGHGGADGAAFPSVAIRHDADFGALRNGGGGHLFNLGHGLRLDGPGENF